MSDLALQTLPREILVEIFSFLNREELLSISTVCKSFLDATNHNRKLEMIFPNSKNVPWLGIRKYSNALIKFSISDELFDILSESGIYLRCLKLCHVYCSLDDLVQVLNICENLREIFVYEGSFGASERRFTIERTFEKIFICHKNLKIFTILKNCQVKSLEVNHTKEFDGIDEFSAFLTNQRQLEHLVAANTDINIFHNLKNLKINLNVKHLKLLNVAESSIDPQIFAKSLQRLSTQFSKVPDFLKSCPNVTSLSLRHKNLNIDQSLPMMKNLHFEFDLCGDFEKLIPEVENLKITQFSNTILNHKPLEIDFRSQKKLKTLEIHDKFVWTLMGNFENLLLKNVRFKSPLFLSSNNNVEYLRLEGCRWTNDALLEHVVESCGKLRILIIHNANLSGKIVTKIEKNCKNLKCFQLVNCVVT